MGHSGNSWRDASVMLLKNRKIRKESGGMNRDLAKMTQEWKQLERKTLEQRKIADEFYERNLMKLIEEDFIALTAKTRAVAKQRIPTI